MTQKGFYRSLVLSISFIAGLSACTINATDTADKGKEPVPAPQKATPVFSNPNKTIPGMNLDGSWVSGCLESTTNDDYLVYRVKLAAGTVERKIDSFKDAACKSLLVSYSESGFYRFIKAYEDDGYTIENDIIKDNVHANSLQQVWLENGILYISDLVGPYSKKSDAIVFTKASVLMNLNGEIAE